MSTKSRILQKDSGEMFIPLNMDGQSSSTSKFWRVEKPIILGVLFFLFMCLNLYIKDFPTILKILIDIVYLVISFFIIKKFVLDFKHFRTVFTRIAEDDGKTSGIYWGISFFKNTDDGDIVNFIDGGKIGCFLKLERGSVIGQEEEFIEQHKEAVSDFYKAVNEKGYSTIFISTMEKAAKDKRLSEIAKYVNSEPNKYIKDILELNLEQIKMEAEFNLYENDTVLIYTTNKRNMETLARDCRDLGNILLGGVYRQIEIMNEDQIVELHKEINGIEYFNLTNAKADLFEGDSASKIRIIEIGLNNGNRMQIRPKEERIIDDIFEKRRNGIKGLNVIEEIAKINAQNSTNRVNMVNSTPQAKKPQNKPVNSVIEANKEPVKDEEITFDLDLDKKAEKVQNTDDDMEITL